MNNLIIESTEVRPAIYWYAKKMEMRLRQNDAKKGYDGWHDGKLYYYLRNVKKCYLKIIDTFYMKKVEKFTEKDIHLAIKKCYDGSNFFMMLADNLRDELIKRGIK